MPLGDSWGSATAGSKSKMNLMTIISGEGTYLEGLDKTEHKLFICTDSGGDLVVDHVYLCSADGTTLLDLSEMVAHSHTSDSDGGELNKIFRLNPKHIDLLLTKTDDLKKAQWLEDVSGTGSIEDKTDGTTGERSIRLRPNGTSGSSATITYPHLKLDWSENSMFQTKLQIETATSIALHTGIGADDITAADSNTRKIQAEVCTTTNNNWWLRTADGSANSASDTGIAISTSRVAIRMKSLVSQANLLIDSNTELEKTSNVPTSGATTDIRLIKHSVKNSTAADRPLLMYGSRVVYYVSDNWV